MRTLLMCAGITGKWGRCSWLILLSIVPGFGQGLGHGTAVAIFRSPETVLAAVDSKEVFTEYHDGIASDNSTLKCKLTTLGNYYAVVSGLVSGTNGFDALRATGNAYRTGSDFNQLTEQVRANVSPGLTALLGLLAGLKIPDFSGTYLNHVILRVAIFGVEGGVPGVRVIEFQAGYSETGKLTVTSAIQDCPGSCGSDRFVYLFGAHEAMERFLMSHPALVWQLNEKRLESLVRLEYSTRSDIVGGPISVVGIDKAGKTRIRGGACSLSGEISAFRNPGEPASLPVSATRFEGVMQADAGETPKTNSPASDPGIPGAARLMEQIRTDIERKLAAAARIWCHQTIFRYSQTGETARPVDKIEAEVELFDGVETYTSVRRGSKRYRALREARGAWSSGEFATILRTSRDVIFSEPGAVTGIETEDKDGIDVLSFRHVSPEPAWVIESGSHPYPVSFEGSIRVARTSGEIKEIQWRAVDLPAKMGVSAVEWWVSFGPAIVAGRPDAPPIRSTYTVEYKGAKKRVDRNVTLFSDFRVYGSEAVITFEPGAPERQADVKAASPGRVF
jgi:hypothetical protein